MSGGVGYGIGEFDFGEVHERLMSKSEGKFHIRWVVLHNSTRSGSRTPSPHTHVVTMLDITDPTT